MYFKTLLILSTISVSFAQINWVDETDGSWAFYCKFNSPDLISTQAYTIYACRDNCKSNPSCTNYNWDSMTSVCLLKIGSAPKVDAVYINDATLACGIKIA